MVPDRPDKLRLFVAVPIPEEVVRWAAQVIEILRDRIPHARWVDPHNMHVTCRFIGWVPEAGAGAVAEVVRSVARRHQPSSVSVAGLGAFPDSARARVLWAGLQDPAGVLTSLAAALDGGLEPLGFAAEKRAFAAHLTLARLKTPGRLELSHELPDLPGAFLVDRLILYRSRLSPKGVRYEDLATEYLPSG